MFLFSDVQNHSEDDLLNLQDMNSEYLPDSDEERVNGRTNSCNDTSHQGNHFCIIYFPPAHHARHPFLFPTILTIPPVDPAWFEEQIMKSEYVIKSILAFYCGILQNCIWRTQLQTETADLPIRKWWNMSIKKAMKISLLRFL